MKGGGGGVGVEKPRRGVWGKTPRSITSTGARVFFTMKNTKSQGYIDESTAGGWGCEGEARAQVIFKRGRANSGDGRGTQPRRGERSEAEGRGPEGQGRADGPRATPREERPKGRRAQKRSERSERLPLPRPKECQARRAQADEGARSGREERPRGEGRAGAKPSRAGLMVWSNYLRARRKPARRPFPSAKGARRARGRRHPRRG